MVRNCEDYYYQCSVFAYVYHDLCKGYCFRIAQKNIIDVNCLSLKSELISKKEDTFMRKKKHFKKKRQQPRPKSKRKVTASKTKKGDTSSFESQMKVAGKQILDLIKDKKTLNTTIHQYVSDI